MAKWKGSSGKRGKDPGIHIRVGCLVILQHLLARFPQDLGQPVCDVLQLSTHNLPGFMIKGVCVPFIRTDSSAASLLCSQNLSLMHDYESHLLIGPVVARQETEAVTVLLMHLVRGVVEKGRKYFPKEAQVKPTLRSLQGSEWCLRTWDSFSEHP